MRKYALVTTLLLGCGSIEGPPGQQGPKGDTGNAGPVIMVYDQYGNKLGPAYAIGANSVTLLEENLTWSEANDAGYSKYLLVTREVRSGKIVYSADVYLDYTQKECLFPSVYVFENEAASSVVVNSGRVFSSAEYPTIHAGVVFGLVQRADTGECETVTAHSTANSIEYRQVSIDAQKPGPLLLKPLSDAGT